MQKASIEGLVKRVLWAALGVILFGLLASALAPAAPAQLRGGFDSALLAAEMADTAQSAAAILDGQWDRMTLTSDCLLIASYAALLWLSSDLASRRAEAIDRERWTRFVPYGLAGLVAKCAVLTAAGADIVENVGLSVTAWFEILLPLATLVKWGALSVALIMVSLVYVTWPLWSEFHVALAAAAFSYVVAGVIGIFGAFADVHKLEHVALPMILGVLIQIGLIIFRRDYFVAHLCGNLACRLGHVDIVRPIGRN